MEMKIKYSVSQGGVAGCDLEAETDSRAAICWEKLQARYLNQGGESQSKRERESFTNYNRYTPPVTNIHRNRLI